ncbi:MAG: dTDP-4-dehydrorhamnose reductase [Gaiellales bacterium]|nr:dTDP-4-dehydrorhamnose reductase [Gaiellales bacterium]
MGSDPRVCVTGAGGQLGRALRASLPGARFLDHAALDVCDRAAVGRELDGCDLVVHAAAFTDVDGCERDPATALAVNGVGAANVAAAGCRVIMVSTDYVFAGRKRGEYGEHHRPAPINAYGRSKLEGERAVLARPGNLVVRTSWLFGEGRNFIRSIVAADRAGRELRVVDDQRGRPTAAVDLAAAIAHLCGRDDRGVLHVAGDGPPCSWADLAELVVGRPVSRISSSSLAAAAPRPRNSALALDRARSLGVPLADWRNSVRTYVEAL